MASSPKALRGVVVGAGSIGQRHAANLLALGVRDLGIVDPDSATRKKVTASLKLTTYESLAPVFDRGVDFALIATPTAFHFAAAEECLSRGVATFVEKPLCHLAAEAQALVAAAGTTPTLVGCNMRFHPGPKKIQELLTERVLGKVYFARIYCGSYLPDWRPQADYRQQYSAQAEGGGCVLDCIHEIDLAQWYLGPVAEVFCASGHLSELEIKSEDVAMLILKHQAGGLSQLELDYVQRRYDRGCHIVGEKGTLNWDFLRHSVTWYDQKTGEAVVYEEPVGYQLNQMYLDEMAHFLDVVRGEATSCLSVKDAAHILDIALQAKQSSETKSMLTLPGIQL